MLNFIYLTSFSKGETVLKTLAKAGHDRKIPIKIAQNEPNGVNANTDYLAKYGKKNHILIFLSLMYMYYK